MPAGVQKLRILSGHVEFSVNNRLCPDKIQSFLSNAVVLGGTGRDLTPSEQDLIVNSNGEYAICRSLKFFFCLSFLLTATELDMFGGPVGGRPVLERSSAA